MGSGPRIDSLTGLRFVAALHVALTHMPHLQRDDSISLAFRQCVMSHGPAVPFFFILSGFILTYRYHQDFTVLTAPRLKRFYGTRSARLWPVHLLTLGFAFFLSPNPNHQNRWDSAILNAFLVQSWAPSELYSQSYNSVAWTLSIEVFFYLCTPFLLWGLARWRASPAQLIAMALPIWLLAATQSIYLSKNPSQIATYLVAVCPLVRLGDFLIGAMLALAYVRSGSTPQATTTQRERVEGTIVEGIALCFLASLLYGAHAVPLYLRLNGYYTILLGILIIVFARQKGYVSHFFASSGPRYLGEISFAFFMIHCLVFVALDRLTPSNLGSWERAALYLQTAGLVAVVVHHMVELPIAAWLLKRHRPATTILAPSASASAT